MSDRKAISIARTFVVALALSAQAVTPHAAEATHKCDPVTEEGWNVVPSRQTLSETDSGPYQAGSPGNWFIDRVTTVLPFCDYFNAIGLYSLNSYSLSPVTTEQRIAICRPAEAGSIAVPPYAGPCPPK
jgi:putative component of membrane protein insertase Oxa1/YidC/SpoIIIJ protein YidD